MIIEPKNELLRIESLWAFVSKDDEGNEGLCGFQTPDGKWIAMVGADEDRVKSLIPYAEHLAKNTKQTISLVKFHTREEIKVIK